MVKKKNWIQGAIKKPGALSRSVKKDEKFKSGKLKLGKIEERAKHTGNETLLKRVQLAKTLKKLRGK